MENLSNARIVTLEEQKEIMLSLLKSIHEFCCENEITYYLAYGSLLGAIRHKGFIPWDDDIDIVMFRDDYEKFVSCYKNENAEVVSFERTEGYYTLIAKVCDKRTVLRERIKDSIDIGVYVDVFVIDYLSDDLSNAKNTVQQINSLYKLVIAKSLLKREGRDLYKEIILYVTRLLLIFINRDSILSKINKIAQKYSDKKDSKYCAAVTSCVYGEKEIMETIWWKDGTALVDFEGLKLCAPKHYDKILTHLYGDYMTLPPIEKQITHHSFDVFWKE